MLHFLSGEKFDCTLAVEAQYVIILILLNRLKMAYRKRKDKDTWHFCSNCSNWPTSNYDEKQTKPANGELCDECKSKQKNGDCKK